MAQITAVPVPVLFPRQLDLTSLLSAGLSVISSILTTDSPANPTSTSASTATTADTTATSASESLDPIVTSSLTSSQTNTRATSTSTRSSSTLRTSQTTSITSSQSSSLSSSISSSTASAASSTSSPAASSGSNKNTLAIVLGVVLGLVCLLLLALLVCLCLRRRRKYGSFFNKETGSPGTDSDGEYYSGAERTSPPPAVAMKEMSPSSSEPTTSPLSHNAIVAAPMAAAMASHHHNQEPHYPPIPAAHQISSIGSRHGDYAYVPNDPFEDGHRAQMNFNRDQQRERDRRSRLSLTLDPVREYPTRERSVSDTRYQPSRRWTAGPGVYGMPSSPPDAQRRRIPRKPVPSMNMGPAQYTEWPFEYRRNNGRGLDSGYSGLGLGTENGSRYPRSGPRPMNPHQRYYQGGSGSF